MKLLLDTHVVLWSATAQALEEGYTIVTHDQMFAAYGVPVLRA